VAMNIYLTGSLRNPSIPLIANQFREKGFEVFDDWFAAGPEADDWWKEYETSRGHTYVQALAGFAADHVFTYDYDHLIEANAVVLVAPAGKSSYLELGFMLGRNVPGFILLPQSNDRWDVMAKFATGVFDDFTLLVKELVKYDRKY
jgi:hypothetical protein